MNISTALASTLCETAYEIVNMMLTGAIAAFGNERFILVEGCSDVRIVTTTPNARPIRGLSFLGGVPYTMAMGCRGVGRIKLSYYFVLYLVLFSTTARLQQETSSSKPWLIIV
jgi:hypothetical protein